MNRSIVILAFVVLGCMSYERKMLRPYDRNRSKIDECYRVLFDTYYENFRRNGMPVEEAIDSARIMYVKAIVHIKPL